VEDIICDGETLMKIWIREGITGILYITNESGKKTRYIPDKDLKESNRLLQEFYKLQSNDGKCIKDSFWKDGINWFPTTIALLHWHILYMYVQYIGFFEKYPMEEYEYIFLNKKRLSNFVSLISSYSNKRPSDTFSRFKLIKKKVGILLKKLNNQRVCRNHHRSSLIFYRYGLKDFRTRHAKKTLDVLRFEYITFASLGGGWSLLRNLFAIKPRPVFVPFEEVLRNDRMPFHTYGGLNDLLEKIFQVAALKIQDQICNFQATYKALKKQLKDTPITKFYGIDDTNSIYPMIYACQANGIKTIGHQHGVNYSRWDAPYHLEGFQQGEYRWFDKVLVWGNYWKKHILLNSSCYSKEQIRAGTCISPVFCPKSLEICGKRGTKNILIPYEFYTDTCLIGKYICALQDLGYTIYFKVRPDDKLSEQLEAYCLPAEREKQLVVVKEITDELMSEIDIVAACCSTIIFDLFPYMKETWLFETKFIFWEELVEQGIAKRIRLEHLEEDINRPVSREINQELVDYVFSRDDLKDVLRRELS